ncbi:MAG: CrcB family protein [Gemmatimonadaceae bacterium]|nr:CrcB family protein [Gemmatimonadaceae bacterium]NUO95220.1 CrcB family protein [Gemmatimonadaceae bacterium]NUP57696.1 CrcB family protein [Gemmatimonadaceae bacterium]NUP71725.1 CrcB family protein [Gemmatimonadaceae bacterium]NUR34469.1 CrcB family protein [Gemmatimonadaceae bacterium]
MLNYLYVAVGSAAGGLARVLAGVWLQERLGRVMPHAGAKPFPIGTLLVNLTGSFVIGVLIVVLARRTSSATMLHSLLVLGFCGGYTTFSTFSADTMALIESGAGALAAMNVAASVGLALLATLAGATLARVLLPVRL